jgi:crotonobetainyl-CoA:carnitine CoA-transferase CaiB-like acyl-CoA transferase
VGCAYAAKLLAECGADVVFVEPPAGSVLRTMRVADNEVLDSPGANFRYLSTYKRIMPFEGSFRADPLARADIVLVDESSGRWGIDPEELRARHPALVIGRLTPYGTVGPLASLSRAENVVEALSGWLRVVGEPDREPVRPAGHQSEYFAGTLLASAVLAAYLRRLASGDGDLVDVNNLQAILLASENTLPLYTYGGQVRQRNGSRLVNMSSDTEMYPTKDGYVMLAAQLPQQWESWCTLIGRADLLEREDIQNWIARFEHYHELASIFAGWTSARTKREAMEEAQLWRVPLGPAFDTREVLKDPQLQARGAFVPGDSSVPGCLAPRLPIRPLPEAKASSVSPATIAPDGIGWSAERRSQAGHPDASAGEAPLSGIRVVDLTLYWAGPLASMLLADLGAEVIKVEGVQRYDLLRFSTMLPGTLVLGEVPETGGWFHLVNRNKKDVAIRLDDERGRDLLLRLVAKSDVLIENFSLRVMKNLRLEWDTLREVNPDLVMVSMPGFGTGGPYQDFVAFGETIEPMSGYSSLNGYRDGPPMRVGVAYGDPAGGIHAVFAALLGLARGRSGLGGIRYELSQLEALLRFTGEYVGFTSATGELAAKMANASPDHAPWGVYPCVGEDERVAVAVQSDEQWRDLCHAVGDPPSGLDSESSVVERLAARDVLDAWLRQWTSARGSEEAASALRSLGIPAVGVLAIDKVIKDAQLAALNAFPVIEHPIVGARPTIAAPFRARGLPQPRHAPLHGQHTREVLTSLLGLSQAEMSGLAEAGVIRLRDDM